MVNISSNPYTEHLFVFDCSSLLTVYTTYLEPYLGAYRYFIDKEAAIMGELYLQLEDTLYPGLLPLSAVLTAQDVKTDIRNYFTEMFMNTSNALIVTVTNLLRHKLLIGFTIFTGYILVAKTIVFI